MKDNTKLMIELALEGDSTVSSARRQAILSAISSEIEQLPAAFLTQAEAARELSVTRQTVRNLVKAGKLHPIEITPGGLLRYRREEILTLGGSK